MKHKKHRQQLAQTLKLGPQASVTNRTQSPLSQIGSMLKQHATFISFLVLVCVAVYANAIPGDFSIVDDIPGIVNRQAFRDLPAVLKTFQLQNSINASFLFFFGDNPVPFHIFAISLHIINTILAFVFICLLFGNQVARLAALIFAVHPVNTEVVTWISGTPYLIQTLFLLLTMIAYWFYKHSKKLRYLFISIAFYALILLLARGPSLLVLPMALVVIDQLILEPRWNWRSLFSLGYFLPPSAIYIVSYLVKQTSDRLATRSSGTFLNSQTLNPILESYPYTIYHLLRLYIFPIKLVIYYDGEQVTKGLYILMVIAALIFVGLVLYSLWRKRVIAGLMLLLPVLIAPAFSPIKITWFIAERYLYLGTIFFAALVALGVIKISQRWRGSYLMIVLATLIVIPLSIRTILRNQDYLDNKQFARVTIKDAPLSVRPYNDLGSLYLMDGDTDTALQYYRQALDLNPLSRTSIHNIGLIYIQTGEANYYSSNFNLADSDRGNYQALYIKGLNSSQNKLMTNSAYYLVESLKIKPGQPEALNLLADIYVNFQKWPVAKKYYLRSLEVDVHQPEIYHKLSFVAGKMGNWVEAKKYTLKTLELNPDHQGAKTNLKLLEQKLGGK